jgi:uncharacterized protein (UPF0548 family)
MRIVLNHDPVLVDGRRYLQRRATSDREGPAHARVDTYRRRVELQPGELPAAAFERVRKRLFDYEIFPPRLVGHAVIPAGEITEGCTVVQRLGVGRVFLESATRVVDVWRMPESAGARSAGFAYVTVQGHPERGVATFEVRQEQDGVFVVLTARSVPGTMLTKLAGPVMRLVQRTITKRAVNGLATNR